VDLTVHRGEILGIGGLAGHGKLGIAAGVLGLHPRRGEVLKDGVPLPAGNPKVVLRSGVAFVSEDRRGVGLMMDESIRANLVAGAVAAKGRFLAGPRWLGPFRPTRARRIDEVADRTIHDLDIRCAGPAQPVRRLSGGNQQKVCLGRAILLEPDLLLVSEPTRGIDVGAKSLVLERLTRLNRDEGVTIVVTSSELAELRSICDRIAIVYGGRVHAVLAPDESNARFGLAMSGEEVER
jgi:simple sugar transport system ATP-binding protein